MANCFELWTVRWSHAVWNFSTIVHLEVWRVSGARSQALQWQPDRYTNFRSTNTHKNQNRQWRNIRPSLLFLTFPFPCLGQTFFFNDGGKESMKNWKVVWKCPLRNFYEKKKRTIEIITNCNTRPSLKLAYIVVFCWAEIQSKVSCVNHIND